MGSMVLSFIAGMVVELILVFVVNAVSVRKRMKNRRKNHGKKKVKIDTYVKAATSIVLFHGLTMITLSYVLAWFGRETVVEVSTTLITEVVAPLCLYMGTNCIMNIFEKNELSFSKPIQMAKMAEANEKIVGNSGNVDDDCDNAVG